MAAAEVVEAHTEAVEVHSAERAGSLAVVEMVA